MNTAIWLAHPESDDSYTQNFLKQSVSSTLPIYDLQHCYPQGKIDRQVELNRLAAADRIILQFPLYWYSAPAILKQWQDQVFIGELEQYQQLAGKECGLVVSLGTAQRYYQAGQTERYTVSELLRPYEAFCHKLGWRFLPIFVMDADVLKTTEHQQLALVDYQMYLTLPQPLHFADKSVWLSQRLLEAAAQPASTSKQQASLQGLAHFLLDKQAELDDLKVLLQDMKEGTRD